MLRIFLIFIIALIPAKGLVIVAGNGDEPFLAVVYFAVCLTIMWVAGRAFWAENAR